MTRRKVMRLLLRTTIVLVLIGGGVAAWAWTALKTPYQGFGDERMLVIEHGSSTRAIAHQLAQAGVIKSEWMFLVQRAISPKVNLQAGQYQFLQAANVAEVFDRLRRGDVYSFEFTVPEGSNIWDIARLLESSGVMKEQDFLKAARDPAPIHDIAPDATSLEGYLFPSTYRLSTNTTAAELCNMMVGQFRKEWRKLNGEKQVEKGDKEKDADNDDEPEAKAIQRTVTLASLVEKETGTAAERSIVAGVFSNRLKIGMALACDPTVVYASMLVGKYRGTIYQSDLDRDHPYNTYKHPGLPPGPIANPGAATLRAALHPADTKFLFFVAKPEGGGHVFSATGAAHARAVQNYRNAINNAAVNANAKIANAKIAGKAQ